MVQQALQEALIGQILWFTSNERFLRPLDALTGSSFEPS
jgi:hypothetical protein